MTTNIWCVVQEICIALVLGNCVPATYSVRLMFMCITSFGFMCIKLFALCAGWKISIICALCGLYGTCVALGSCVVCVSVLSVIATPSAYVVWTLALGLSLALFLWWNHLHFQATKWFSSTDINLWSSRLSDELFEREQQLKQPCKSNEGLSLPNKFEASSYSSSS